MGLTMARGSAPRRLLTLASVLLAVLLAHLVVGGFNLLLRRPALRVRLDLSPREVFTLSPLSRSQAIGMVARKDYRIRIEAFFYSPRLGRAGDPHKPLYDALARIRGEAQEHTARLLDLYDLEGGGRVETRIYNGDREVEATRRAAARLEVSRRIGPDKDLIVVSRDRRKEILELKDLCDIRFPDTPVPGGAMRPPILESFTGEQSLSTAIRTVCLTGNPRALFLVGHEEVHPDSEGPGGLSRAKTMLLEEGFELGVLDLGEKGEVPAECDILVVVQPLKRLNTKEVETIREWFAGGGRLFVAHGYRFASQVPLAELVGPFGIDAFTGDPRRDRPVCWGVPRGDRAGGLVFGHEQCRIPGMIGTLNRHHPITEPLHKARRWPYFIDALALRLDDNPPAGLGVQSLGKTVNTAWESGADASGRIRLYPDRPNPRGVFDLAAAGTWRIKPEEGKEREARAVVFGSSDAILNGMLEQYSANQDLLRNAFNWLAERSELVRVEPRERRFVRLEKPTPHQQTNLAWTLFVLFPGLVVAAGVVVYLVRRR